MKSPRTPASGSLSSLPVCLKFLHLIFLFHSLSVSACRCLCVLLFLSLSLQSSFMSQDPCICCPLYLESPGFWACSFFSAQMAPPQVCLPPPPLSSIISLLFAKHTGNSCLRFFDPSCFFCLGTLCYTKALSFIFSGLSSSVTITVLASISLHWLLPEPLLPDPIFSPTANLLAG